MLNVYKTYASLSIFHFTRYISSCLLRSYNLLKSVVLYLFLLWLDVLTLYFYNKGRFVMSSYTQKGWNPVLPRMHEFNGEVDTCVVVAIIDEDAAFYYFNCFILFSICASVFLGMKFFVCSVWVWTCSWVWSVLYLFTIIIVIFVCYF